MMWQHCERFKPVEECATPEEKAKFFGDLKVTLLVAQSFIKFNEPDTEKAIEARVIETLKVDTASKVFTNVKGFVTLSPNEA